MKKLVLGIVLLFVVASISYAQTPARVTLQNGATTGNGVIANASGYTTIGLQIVQNSSGDRVVNFEATVDGSHYAALTCRNVAANTNITTIAADGVVTCNIGGINKFRARVSGGTTGTVTVYGLMLQNASANGSPSISGTAVANLADPSGTVGLTQTAGVATNAMRNDGIPALSQAIVPTWTGIHTHNDDVRLITPVTGLVPVHLRHVSGATASGSNDIAQWGMGEDAGGGLVTAGREAIYTQMERHYDDGAGNVGSEWHIDTITAAGVGHRHFMVNINHPTKTLSFATAEAGSDYTTSFTINGKYTQLALVDDISNATVLAFLGNGTKQFHIRYGQTIGPNVYPASLSIYDATDDTINMLWPANSHDTWAIGNIKVLGNLYSDASNYERLGINMVTGAATITAETAGAGADNISLTLEPAGAGDLVLGKASGGGTLTIKAGLVTPASSGTRALCLTTAGVVVSSASACSGT